MSHRRGSTALNEASFLRIAALAAAPEPAAPEREASGILEIDMPSTTRYVISVPGSMLAAALLASPGPVFAASDGAAHPHAAMQLAALSNPAPSSAIPQPVAWRPHEAGVRAAAAEGNEALRRYVHRTR